jgi:hypothetical protein
VGKIHGWEYSQNARAKFHYLPPHLTLHYFGEWPPTLVLYFTQEKPIKSTLISYPTFLLELTKKYFKNRMKKIDRNFMRILISCIIFFVIHRDEYSKKFQIEAMKM